MVYMLYISSILCLFYLGARGYIEDWRFLGQAIEVSVIVAFYQYINKFFNPIQNLAEQFNWLQSAFASAEKIFTIFDMEPEVTDVPDAVELDSIEGNIEFRDVWFAYKPEEWILKGISFTVKAGESVALVGPTGAGKSTIVNLISRFYNVNQGRVLIDGQDIAKVTLHSLRSQMGIMLQDSFIFSGTIIENIRYGRSLWRFSKFT
jgi:ATP-binding cassette subfamily B protein